jgi:glutamyl-tRNA reductase
MLWRGCVLRVGVIGMNFKTAPLSLLEKASQAAQFLAGERALFFKYPTIILSTCNRMEIYFSGDDLAEAQGDILSFFRMHIDVAFEHKLYSYFGIDALTHLCRVTAGLDSAIVTETEIQRQVKVAYLQSKDVQAIPECLHYVFQKALKVAKELRSQLFLEKGATTLYKTLWQIGVDVLGDLKEKKILLVGYSEMNRGFARLLIHKGKKEFSLCTRNPEKVFLEGAICYGREELKKWAEYDLIVCASHADKYLIEGMGKGGLIFDLSVPRNVNPEVQNVLLMNIEQIHQSIDIKEEKGCVKISECEDFIEKQALHLARLYRAKMEKKPFALSRS